MAQQQLGVRQQLFAGLLVRRWTSAELLSLDQELLRQELLGPVDDAAERQLREGSVEWQQQRRMDEEEDGVEVHIGELRKA